MIPIDENSLDKLAREYAPVLRFHPSERFFPLLVESWLTTTSQGVWPEADSQNVHLRTAVADPGRKGAAVCIADAAMTALTVLAGPPDGGSRPISLSDDSDDRYSLLSDLIAAAGKDAFLNVGGWESTDFAEGDLSYLTDLCSELGSAMNPTIPWTPAQDRDQAPWSWIRQPPHPTIYCELTWAGSYPRVGQMSGSPEFPPDERSLDNIVAFTYHLFYGARTPPSDEGGSRMSEGQWEAITLYFRADVSRAGREGQVRVSGGAIAEEPFAVVISQCQNSALGDHWTAMREYSQCERLGKAPVIYVAKGTHRNYFEPVDGETFDPTQGGPHGPDTTTHNDEDDSWIGVDGFLASAGVLLGIAILLVILLIALLAVLGVLAIIAVIVVIIILVILAIILFIMWLVSACDEDSDSDAGESVTFEGDPDEAGGGGPQSGGDGSEEPAGPTPASGGSPSGGGGSSGGGPDAHGSVGLPNSGSPTGRSTAFPDIRLVERLLEDGAFNRHTTFPADQVMENPPWWDYRGRWGVRVKPAPASGTWESGWHRVDDRGRDWGYYNAERLLIAMNGGPTES